MSDQSEHYIDAEQPVSNLGIKLSPNEHAPFYAEVRGHSEARGLPEEPKEGRPLPRKIRRLCAHPGERDYDGLLQ